MRDRRKCMCCNYSGVTLRWSGPSRFPGPGPRGITRWEGEELDSNCQVCEDMGGEGVGFGCNSFEVSRHQMLTSME